MAEMTGAGVALDSRSSPPAARSGRWRVAAREPRCLEVPSNETVRPGWRDDRVSRHLKFERASAGSVGSDEAVPSESGRATCHVPARSSRQRVGVSS